MKKLKMILKMIGIVLGGAIAVVLIIGVVFVNTSPQFGGKATKEQKEFYTQSGHYKDGKFENLIPTNMDMPFGKTVKIMKQFFKGDPSFQPKEQPPIEHIDSLEIVKKENDLHRVTWFGHSAFLLEAAGKNILIDPMMGEVAAPHSLLGSKRFNQEQPISLEKLPQIDLVIISHDHYDHLDYGSIQRIKNKVGHFYTPLGVGNHLVEWGVEKEQVHELNWWDEIEHEDIKLICTPSRHFSGRGLFNRFSTLWSSWIIQTPQLNIYFSGDGGYGPHFKEIGEKYGPFDFAMMECGQYNENWSEIHMMPEETAQAAVDVQAKLMMPIHWGAFKLALHGWTDPIERVSTKASELNVSMTTPKIGESVVLNSGNYPVDQWWLN